MPLHDWTDPAGWEGVHGYWIVELARCIKASLPSPYRAYIGSTPALMVGAVDEKPDVAVRHWGAEPAPAAASAGGLAPDSEATALLTLDPQTAVHVTLHGRLVGEPRVARKRLEEVSASMLQGGD
ncbi:MAG: hypothetical protein K2W96_06360, partial [Gemmataceae bacterium]|nr:hypothetical protein [Gemmataceae bacterium]